jgi:hypothetical protein
MRRAAGVFVLLLVPVLAFTQKPTRVSAMPIDDVTVRPGGSTPITMEFRVAPGYHINSNKPKSELLVPTVVNLSVPTNLSVAGMTYPVGEDLTFPFSPDEKLNVYTGDFTLKAKVIAAKAISKGTYRVHGMLRYQACDNRACYPPTNIPLTFDIHVSKAASASTRRNPGQSPHAHR